MGLLSGLTSVLLVASQLRAGSAASVAGRSNEERELPGKITPKFFIIDMFGPEGDVWYENLPSSGLGDLNAVNITVPGLSMLYPDVHCVEDLSICELITGEAEINAASSIMALILSDKFDFTLTYWMIAGIAGVNPKVATLGSVALARFSVQVAQQYELDAREMPAGWPTGYFAYGTYAPNEYPGYFYGTEVFEVNEALRDMAYKFAAKANLSDSSDAQEYRNNYKLAGPVYEAATTPPTLVKCDTATSDVYYSGAILSQEFENVTNIWTNGSGIYCMTAQEDCGTLEVMVRGQLAGRVDFSRVIVMRTGSDFDRPPPNVTPFDNLAVVEQNGFDIAVQNIYNTGVEIVKGVLDNWDCTFKKGVKPNNYIGDVFGSLGGAPDFGPGSIFGGQPAKREEAPSRRRNRRRW